MNYDFGSMLFIIILDLAVCLFLYFLGRRIYNFLDKGISRLGNTMILWDLALFGRNYFLRLLEKKQKHIDKARDKKKTLIYILLTRPQYAFGVLCCIYAAIVIFTADNPSAQFLQMAEVTFAGAFLDFMDLTSGSNSDISGTTFILAMVGNYIANWLFIRRFRQDEDNKTLNLFIRILLNILEIVLFAGTTLFISDILSTNPVVNFADFIISGDMVTTLFSFILFALVFVSLLYPIGKMLLTWLKDMLDSFAVLGTLFLVGFLIDCIGYGKSINNDLLFILCILLCQKLVEWLFYGNAIRNLFRRKPEPIGNDNKTNNRIPDENDIIPRKYIRKRYKDNSLTCPEYYNISP